MYVPGSIKGSQVTAEASREDLQISCRNCAKMHERDMSRNFFKKKARDKNICFNQVAAIQRYVSIEYFLRLKLYVGNNEVLAVICPLYRCLKYGFDRGSISSSKN